MQLHLELTQIVLKNRVWGHAKPSSKEILEHDSLIRSRIRHRLHPRGSTIPFGKIVTIAPEGHEAGFCHS
jgi:hypothetical protein